MAELTNVPAENRGKLVFSKLQVGQELTTNYYNDNVTVLVWLVK